MTFTISLGWWLAPLAVTIAAGIWSVTGINSLPKSTSGIAAAAAGVVALGYLAMGAIPSLVAWLIWALCR